MRKYVGCLLAAYLSTHSISYLMNLRNDVPFSYSFLTALMWIGLSVLYLWTYKNLLQEKEASGAKQKRRLWCAGLFSWFFGSLFVAGYQLQWIGSTAYGYKGKLGVLLYGFCVGLVVFPLLYNLIRWLDVVCCPKKEQKPWKGLGIFLGSWLGIWLCWIPVWLAYYPVIMSYDFHRQSLEALWGPEFFNTHHPLAHTWLIYVFRNVGIALDSFETGYALFSLLQQLIVSLVLGYACLMVYRLTHKKWMTVVSALFLGLFPLVSVMVMCTTKDVLFGAFFVLFVLLFVERTYFSKGIVWDILWVLSSVLMMLFRNNAFYALIVFGVLFVVLGRGKTRWQALLLMVIMLVAGKGALAGLQHGFGAASGNDIEKYSVIYQSMARVGLMQRPNLTAEEYAMIDHYVVEECWDSYNPPLADTIKGAVISVNINERNSWEDMGAVLKDWVSLGLKYPNEYIDAFLNLTRGYWFLDDTSHAEMLGVGLKERMGLLYTYNSAAPESILIQHLSKFPWLETQLENLLSANSYYQYPVISNLFKPALWCWILVFCGFLFFYRKDRKSFLITLYPLAYFGTMLLGPTAVVRYVYPFIILTPVLLALVFANKSENEA